LIGVEDVSGSSSQSNEGWNDDEDEEAEYGRRKRDGELAMEAGFLVRRASLFLLLTRIIGGRTHRKRFVKLLSTLG